MEKFPRFRICARLAVLSAFWIAGCYSEHGIELPQARAACPEGLSLETGAIGLSYVSLVLDSCNDRAARHVLEMETNGESEEAAIAGDFYPYYRKTNRFPIYPGAVFRFRLASVFADSTRLVSRTLELVYPDSAGDFAPIRVGDAYDYACDYHGNRVSSDTLRDAEVRETGSYGFRVLSRSDSAGIAVYRVEYRDSIVHATRPFDFTGSSPWDVDTLFARDTTGCSDDGVSVHCGDVQTHSSAFSFPWAAAHVLRKPDIGLAMPPGGQIGTCAQEFSGYLPASVNFRGGVFLPGTGMIRFLVQNGSGRQGYRQEGRADLVRKDGGPVDFRAYADICFGDIPAGPVK